MAKKKTSQNEFLKKLWSALKFICEKSYRLTCTILMTIYHFLKLVFLLLKTFLFGISSFIAANALMILSLSLSIYLLSSAIGLSDSPEFQKRRDAFMSTQFELIDEHILYREVSSEAKTQGFKLKEITDVSCNETTNCATPNKYLIQSNCPYTSLCLQDRCAVVCPREFTR
ncbi:MAG: hypothetical protein P1V18_05445 [Candidatus Gracilibacteria bacterium]|nr:hypothetical protein [Candidatus Gracilibacteria bacterium]